MKKLTPISGEKIVDDLKKEIAKGKKVVLITGKDIKKFDDDNDLCPCGSGKDYEDCCGAELHFLC